MKTASQPAKRILLAPVALGLLLSLALIGCKEDEAPPPLPSAAPPPPPAAPIELAPEPVVMDAGTDAGAAPKPKGTGRPGTSLKKCCAALRQNAANAPPPNDGYMLTAAALCDGAVASGAEPGSIVRQLQAALKGAGMPAACQ